MLRVLGADDVDVFSTLSPHALAAVTQLLDRAAHLHAADLLSVHEDCRGARRLKAEFLESTGDSLRLRGAA